MAEAPNRIEQMAQLADPNAGRFHVGNAPQGGIPPDLTDEEVASLEAHQATIKVPKSQVVTEPEPEPEPEAPAARAAKDAPEKPAEKPPASR